VTGRILRVHGNDTVAVAGQWAVLHAVTLTTGGPVDSQRTDRAGRYALRVAAVDTSASYLLSVEYDGIGYFSPPIPPDSLRAAHAPLLVYDTSSTGPPIVLQERHVLVEAPGPEGARRAVELLVLANRGRLTRVSPDSTTPTWQGTMPPGAEGFELGLSDFPADAIEVRGETLRVYAPIPPGERQILAGYLLPAGIGAFDVPVDQPVGRLDLLLGDSTATLAGAALPLIGMDNLGGQPLRRFGGDSVPAGATISIRFPSRARAPGTVLVWILVPLMAALMVLGVVVWWRRPNGAAEPAADPTVLAAEIAALDAAYRGREDAEYRRRRAELKQRLEAALAGGGASG
jgi:hypothetical protein